MDLQDSKHNDESESPQSTVHHAIVTCTLVNLFHKQPLEYCIKQSNKNQGIRTVLLQKWEQFAHFADVEPDNVYSLL